MALHDTTVGAGPYSLKIWQGKKVFSLEWADDGRTYIVSFKRGAWEAEFLALDISTGMPSAGQASSVA
jgi:hypothetical protein